MQHQRTVLVTAAGGHIGSELVPRLLDLDDVKLVLPTSNASRLQSGFPSTATADNITLEEGSIRDPQWVEAILLKHSVDTVFLCLTGVDELLVAFNFLDAMQRASCVKHLVYLSACGDFLSSEGIEQIMRTCSAAHVLVKSTIEQKIAYGGFPWTTTRLGPTLFFTNDERNKASLREDGFFGEPLGEKGVSRVSTSDIALAACNAILQPEKWDGRKIMVGSLPLYTGSNICRLYSEAVGRDVTMRASDQQSMANFEKSFVTARAGIFGADMAKAWGRDFRLVYEYFSEQGFGMSDAEYRKQVELLGREPESYEEWVEKTVRGWR
ncbi:hypothetical protein LTR36_009506 [Oleoguttula mirabilis]|uniref:NmrA-like domain-containing protein n=1 Tax=Oleoguttula mirabilis TaxID=1507867 RepID=A0AAV9JUC1_9PEZI|nr:hypothetical protein LTR36_009506 [Oleoguttula mirabilis]